MRDHREVAHEAELAVELEDIKIESRALTD